MENVIRDAITNHLEKHSLIVNQQHGFVKKKACITNFLKSLELTTKAISQKESMDVLYLDFAKAFDKVPHQRLIHKLAQYGIQNKMLNWIKAFLSNRRQRVVLGDSISSWTHVSSGVPQGSVLGPTLFIIYINDLPDKLINPNEIYADDTKIFCKIN